LVKTVSLGPIESLISGALIHDILQKDSKVSLVLPFHIHNMPFVIDFCKCRQILKVLGFINEPHQAPIPFVPAAMQTADATSSLPGATLM
jgi:hypothetical protein